MVLQGQHHAEVLSLASHRFQGALHTIEGFVVGRGIPAVGSVTPENAGHRRFDFRRNSQPLHHAVDLASQGFAIGLVEVVGHGEPGEHESAATQGVLHSLGRRRGVAQEADVEIDGADSQVDNRANQILAIPLHGVPGSMVAVVADRYSLHAGPPPSRSGRA